MSTVALADYGPSTIDDYDALPEDNTKRYELIDGRVVVSPRPLFGHQDGMAELLVALHAALPPGYKVVTETEVSFRDRQQCLVPDLLVIKKGHTRAKDRHARSESVVLAIEIHSPSSKRSDREVKPRIYAAGSIPAYWLVETDPFSVTEHRLVGRWYEVGHPVTGDEIVVTQPFDLKVDLTGARAATLPDGE